jgi:hypothetical protein
MQVRHFPWLSDDEDDSFAWLGPNDPKGLGRNDWRLTEGVHCADWFPGGLVFDLSKQDGIKLTDSVPNTSALLVVSEKLRRVLEREATGAVIEYLPIRLRNQKGKVVAKPYFLANVIGSVRCVDVKKSDFEMNRISKDQVSHFRRLVLDERKIPTSAGIFRLAEKTALVLVRQDLASAIIKSGCTGMLFQELEEYGSEFRG